MSSRPEGGPLKLVAILTATKPGPGPGPCLMLPERLTLKGPFSELDCELGLLAFALVLGAAGEEEVGALEASSDTGVPERRAQPCPSGPPGSHRIRAIGPIAVRANAPPRTRGCSGQPGSVRTHTAIATASTQIAVSASNHALLTSLPVPRPCSRAIGQHAYASQCVIRQARCPRRSRSMLVMATASSRSNATAPSPSQNGR